MKSLVCVIVAAMVLCGTSQVFAEGYNFKPGLWESTTKMEIIGLPENMAKMMQDLPSTSQECISSSDLVFEENEDCSFEKNRINANKLSLNVVCTMPEGVAKGIGEVTFNNETSAGWFEVEMPTSPFGPMKMKTSFTSRYIGVCK